MTALETLLAVQERDTAIDRLRHKRATLPEKAALAAAQEKAAELDQRLAEARERHGAVADRQAALEKEVAATEARVDEVDRRMYSGTVSASRDLQAMAAEVESLKVRRSKLEDEVLAAMEEDEPLAAEVAALEAERAAVDDEAERLRAAVAEAEAALSDEEAGEQSARDELAGGVPTELLTTYDRLRAKLGGVGAARLVGPSCGGCHLTLPATELDRVRHAPPDELVFCDQCGRILVR
jgi:predicted  nucleic acid-binding Zn-ribbon protein